MRTLLTASFILTGMMLLVNCSPKTAKHITQTPQPPKTEPVAETAPRSTNAAPLPATLAPVQTAQQVTEDVPVTNPMATMSMPEKVDMYNGMAPVRIEIGKKLFSTHCNKCHPYKQPETRNAESWVKVMDKMGPKAHLNTDESLEVTGYLVQNAKK